MRRPPSRSAARPPSSRNPPRPRRRRRRPTAARRCGCRDRALWARPRGPEERDDRDDQRREEQQRACGPGQVTPPDQRRGDAVAVRSELRASARGQRRQHGQPEGAAHLLGGVDETGCHPRVLRGGVGHRDGHDRRQGQAASEGQQHDAGQHVGGIRTVDRRSREQGEPSGDRDKAGDENDPGPETPLHAREDEQRHGADAGGDGQDAKTRLGRRESEHALEVQADQELESEHGADLQDVNAVRPHHRPGSKDGQRKQRSPGCCLPGDEPGQRGGGEHGGQARASVHDGEDGGHDAADEQHRAEDVGAPVKSLPVLGRQDPPPAQHREDADGDVDEERPAPSSGIGDHPAAEHADRRARGAHERVDADRACPRARILEQGHDHAKRHPGRHGAADALCEACGHERGGRLRGPARRGGRHEERHAAQQDARASNQIPQSAGEQQQPAEADQVGIDHPGEVGGTEAEIALDARQRHADHRLVDDDHQRRCADDREGEALGGRKVGTSRSRHGPNGNRSSISRRSGSPTRDGCGPRQEHVGGERAAPCGKASPVAR